MRIVFLLMLAVLASASFPAGAQEAHPEWGACQNKDQCVLTCQACIGNVAINKEFIQHAADGSVMSCLQSIPCYPDAMAKCVDQKCTVIRPEKNQ